MMGLAAGLSAFGMASIFPALPAIAKATGSSFAETQFVVSAYLLGLGLCQPFQGQLSDRFGRKPVMLIGFALFLTASLIASQVHSLPVLIVCRFLQAAGASVATVLTRAIVRDTHNPADAAVAIAFISAVMGAAPIIAPIAGGLVVSSFDWHNIFLLHALIAALLIFWLLGSLRETRPQQAGPGSLRQMARDSITLLGDRQFLGYTLAYGFVSAASFIFIPVGAEIFLRRYGMAPVSFGAVWSTLAISYMVGSVWAGRTARRKGAAMAIRTGVFWIVAASGFFFAVAASRDSPLWLFCLALIAVMGPNGIVSPLALAGAVSDRPHLAGLAAGLSSALAMLISMLAAMASGVSFDGSALSIAWLLPPLCVAAWFSVRVALRP